MPQTHFLLLLLMPTCTHNISILSSKYQPYKDVYPNSSNTYNFCFHIPFPRAPLDNPMGLPSIEFLLTKDKNKKS